MSELPKELENVKTGGPTSDQLLNQSLEIFFLFSKPPWWVWHRVNTEDHSPLAQTRRQESSPGKVVRRWATRENAVKFKQTDDTDHKVNPPHTHTQAPALQSEMEGVGRDLTHQLTPCFDYIPLLAKKVKAWTIYLFVNCKNVLH